jgi:regulatory Fis family protein
MPRLSGGRRNVPPGSLLSAQRVSPRNASVAGAERGHPGAGGILHRSLRAKGREKIPARQQADTRPPAVLSVAWERARVQNVIERSVIVSDTDEFTVDESRLSAAPPADSRLGLSSPLAAHEKAIVEDALRASGGRVFGPSGAAARLGIPRSTLESKIRALKSTRVAFARAGVEEFLT